MLLNMFRNAARKVAGSEVISDASTLPLGGIVLGVAGGVGCAEYERVKFKHDPRSFGDKFSDQPKPYPLTVMAGAALGSIAGLAMACARAQPAAMLPLIVAAGVGHIAAQIETRNAPSRVASRP